MEQIFRVILQQAAQAWDGLTGTSPVHLRLPGQDKKDVLGASSCLPPRRLPARTYTLTHSLSHAMREREGERGGGVEVGGDDSGGLQRVKLLPNTVMEGNVPLTSS